MLSSRVGHRPFLAGNLDLKALDMAKNLRGVFAQVESGQVEEIMIRKRFGPTHGSLGCTADWKTMKAVYKGGVYAQLASEFNGDGDFSRCLTSTSRHHMTCLLATVL